MVDGEAEKVVANNIWFVRQVWVACNSPGRQNQCGIFLKAVNLYLWRFSRLYTTSSSVFTRWGTSREENKFEEDKVGENVDCSPEEECALSRIGRQVT